jgi:hypothetical protein
VKLLINAIARHRWMVGAIALLGVALRLWATSRGFNYDVQSYAIVAQIMADGGNVYKETSRYNYGPIWFHLLHFLDLLGGGGPPALRWKVAAFLTVVDLGIFTFLLRRYSLVVATLFFLNPISILITGYHSQFDNLAVLIALVSIAQYDSSKGPLNRWLCLVGLGLSLMTKHLLFVFPFWLAIKERTWLGRAVVLMVPVLIFLVGFLPYLPEGAVGIAANVFLYRSFDNAPLWTVLTPWFLQAGVPKIGLFIGSLVALGIWARDKPPLESLHYYMIAVVAFSSAVANQYLAVCLAAVAVQWNWVFALYSIVGGVFLSIDGNGLHSTGMRELTGWGGEFAYYILICLLAGGLLVAVLRDRKRRSADTATQPAVHTR